MAESDFRGDRRRSASLLSLARPGAPRRPENPPMAVERHRAAARARAVNPVDQILSELDGLEDFETAPEPSPEEFEDFADAALAGAPVPARAPYARTAVRAPVPPRQRVAAPASPPPPLPPSHDGDDRIWRPLIEPMSVVNGVLRSRGLILAMTVAGAALGIAIALSTPKKYEASAELLIDPRDLKITDKDLTQGNGLPSDATLAIVENQVRVITSGSVLTKVVTNLHLDQDPEFNGEAGSFGLSALIAEARGLLSRGGSAKADNRFTLAMENLGRALSVERAGKTFVVTIGATTQVPEKSATIANETTKAFLETYGTLQSGTAGRATDEITARLSELRSSVEAAERKVEDFRSQHDLVDAQGRLISDDTIVRLNDQLSQARARTLELNARAATTKGTGVDDVLGGSLPEQVASPVLTELRAQYAALKQQADAAGVKFGPRHPQSIQIAAQLTGSRQAIAQELRVIASATQVDLKRAVELEQSLAARLAELKVRQAGMNDELVALRELDRDASSKRAVYEAFLLRARETGEQEGINTANMSVISTAGAPLQPIGPSRAITVIVGAMLGFMAGIGLGGLRGVADGIRANGRRLRRVEAEPVRVLQPGPDPEPRPEPDLVPEPAAPPARGFLGALRRRRLPPAAAPAPAPVPPAPPPQPAARRAPQPELDVRDSMSVEEIRDSLREVRDAIRELAETRRAGR